MIAVKTAPKRGSEAFLVQCPFCNAAVEWRRCRFVRGPGAGVIEFHYINLEPDAPFRGAATSRSRAADCMPSMETAACPQS